MNKPERSSHSAFKTCYCPVEQREEFLDRNLPKSVRKYGNCSKKFIQNLTLIMTVTEQAFTHLAFPGQFIVNVTHAEIRESFVADTTPGTESVPL
jgi:hypothetical protein